MLIKLQEMYDLSTSSERLGLIAIRTPSMSYINRKWPGFLRNFRFVRASHCDVQIACAQTLPVDPLQVGTDENKVSPQDMFNPILYRILSNDAWNGLLNRVYAMNGSTSLSDSVTASVDAFSNLDFLGNQDIYYSCLADGSWLKAHPQSGLTARNVRPLVWTMLHTVSMPLQATPDLSAPSSDVPGVSYGASAMTTVTGEASYMRGHAQRMPRVPTYLGASTTGGTDVPVLGYLPRVYCMAIMTPPATNTILYYRMVVNWYIEFTEPRSDLEWGLIKTANSIGSASHYTNNGYLPADKISTHSDTAVENADDYSVEADGLDMRLVMEK